MDERSTWETLSTYEDSSCLQPQWFQSSTVLLKQLQSTSASGDLRATPIPWIGFLSRRMGVANTTNRWFWPFAWIKNPVVDWYSLYVAQQNHAKKSKKYPLLGDGESHVYVLFLPSQYVTSDIFIGLGCGQF